MPGKSHGLRSLVGCSPWGREESDTTERLHFHFSLLCFGEGNGNPLQCSCLENPRNRGAWWAAVCAVTQSWTRLKRLSSSSSSSRDRTQVSCIAGRLPSEPSGKLKNTGVGTLSLLQGIFLTQESNWGLLICRWILYRLSYQGSPVGCLLLLLLLLSRFSRVRLSATP